MHQGGDEVHGGAPVCIRVDGQVGEGGLDGDVGLGVAVLRVLQGFEGFKLERVFSIERARLGGRFQSLTSCYAQCVW